MQASHERRAMSSCTAVETVWRQLGQMYGSPFGEKFGPVPKDGAWVDALKDLRMDQVRSALTRIRNNATPLYEIDLPKFLQLARNAQPPSTYTPAPSFDDFHRFGQRCLMKFVLAAETTVAAERMRDLVEAKNRLVNDFRSLNGECEVTAEEMREALFRAFERVAA
jgi:hypothetical protein